MGRPKKIDTETQFAEENKDKKYCPKCRRTLKERDNFYSYRDGSKCELCKECLTLQVNNYLPETYLWLCEKFDIPYIEEEWMHIVEKERTKYPEGIPSSAVFGKYLAKMHLAQWKKYHYADTEVLKEELQKKKEAALANKAEAVAQAQELLQKYQSGEISKEEYEIYSGGSTHRADIEPPPQEPVSDYEPEEKGTSKKKDARGKTKFREEDFEDEISQDEVSEQLTNEDKIYLQMKWGRFYKPSEWVEMERKYVEMSESFDIQDSDTKGSLILICKTYLKMNQALDEGDIDEYNKLARTYDALRKSANFTAIQNKKERQDFIDSLGELVSYCEKNGGQIPRYTISTDYDIVDTVIRDMKAYTKSLIYEDTALAAQIEQYLKKKENADTHTDLAEQQIHDIVDNEEVGTISEEEHLSYLAQDLEDREKVDE